MFDARSTAELIEHYREVRQRLTDVSAPSPVPPKFRPAMIRRNTQLIPAHIAWSRYLSGEWLAGSPKPIPNILRIQGVVGRHYGISRIDLLSDRRTANVVRPRQVAMYLCKTLTYHSFPEIGRRTGGRDHTTVLHAVAKISRLLLTDNALAADVAAIRQILEGA